MSLACVNDDVPRTPRRQNLTHGPPRVGHYLFRCDPHQQPPPPPLQPPGASLAEAWRRDLITAATPRPYAHQHAYGARPALVSTLARAQTSHGSARPAKPPAKGLQGYGGYARPRPHSYRPWTQGRRVRKRVPGGAKDAEGAAMAPLDDATEAAVERLVLDFSRAGQLEGLGGWARAPGLRSTRSVSLAMHRKL